MVKPEKVDHLHLAYHFTVPLSQLESFFQIKKSALSATFRKTQSQVVSG